MFGDRLLQTFDPLVQLHTPHPLPNRWTTDSIVSSTDNVTPTDHPIDCRSLNQCSTTTADNRLSQSDLC